MEAFFLGKVTIALGFIPYRARRGAPCIRTFFGLAGHGASMLRRLCVGRGVYSGAYARLYALVHGMVVRLEVWMQVVCSAAYAWYTVICICICIYMHMEGK